MKHLEWNKTFCGPITKNSVYKACKSALFSRMKNYNKIINYPNKAGYWHWFENKQSEPQLVFVEESANGRFCRELKMGGSIQHGYSDWKGFWLFLGATLPYEK